MSILKFRAPEITAAELQKRIADKDAEHAALGLGQRETALAWATDPSLKPRLDEIVRRMRDLRDEIHALEAAHGAAVERDEQQKRAQLAALRQTAVNSVKRHFDLRNAAAAKLSAAFAEVGEHWRALLTHSEKAHAASPGGSWPAGALCGPGELKRLVAAEMYRLAGDPSLGNARSLPGAEPVDLRHLGDLNAIPPLADVLKRAGDHTVAVLRGEVAG
jgi:hypothetical protein